MEEEVVVEDEDTVDEEGEEAEEEVEVEVDGNFHDITLFVPCALPIYPSPPTSFVHRYQE